MNPALRFENVSKRYGAAAALDAVGFEVAAGETFGLAGVNGAGKTTLLKCMLDLTSPDAGCISIFGVASTDYRARERVCFLPERFTPPYFMRGRDFLSMMAGLRRDAYDEAAARAMLERLDLDPAALDRPVRAYSKGMTQKLGLAACFLADREILILDEPMSGLDPKARARVKDLLAEARDRGRTLFFTSHALADVDEVCERMAVLDAGRLCFAGAPAELRERSAGEGLERAFLELIAGRASA